MNNTFVSIMLNHEKAISKYNEVFMVGMTYAKQLKESTGIKEGDYMPYAKPPITPNGYTNWLAGDSRKVAHVINNLNKNILAKNVDTLKKPPVGMEVPTSDVKSDDEIKSYYKDLRTVLHDRFQELAKISEGGEGWVKFIDTLATPEERAANYAIPQDFDSVYRSYLNDKKITKATKSDVTKAIKTICDYDKKMGQIVKEADEYTEEYKQKAWKLNNNEKDITSFTEFAKHIASLLYLVEEDYINSCCLQSRKNALLEEVKNANKVIAGLSTHNPRNLKETSFINANQMRSIEMYIDSIDEDVNPYLPENQTSELGVNVVHGRVVYNKRFDELIEAWTESNNKFLERFSKANIQLENMSEAGMPMMSLYEINNISSFYDDCIVSINNKLDHRTLSKMSAEELIHVKEDATNFFKSFSEPGVVNESFTIHSPVLASIRGMIAGNDFLVGKGNNHILTKNDVKKALRLVKEAKDDINMIRNEYLAIREQIFDNYTNPDRKVSPKTKMLYDIEYARKESVREMLAMKIEGLVEQFGIMQAQSRSVLLKASKGLVPVDESYIKEVDELTKKLQEIMD